MSTIYLSVDDILDKNETSNESCDRGIDLEDDSIGGSPMSQTDSHSTEDSFGHASSEEEADMDEVQDGGGSGDSGVDTGINLEEYLNRSNTLVIYPEPVEEDRRSDYKGDEEENCLEPVNCPYCDRTYKRLTSLKEHIKYRHEKGTNSFSCLKCNYCFAHQSQLERHMATHMPGRNQVCEICNKAFVNIYRLQRHMLTHTSGNRKFKCSECSKAFKYKHHLKEHLRIHSGEKPYECPICRKRFSHSGSYSSHISSKKCSPVHVLPIIKDTMAAPVKVVIGDVLPDSNEGIGKENNGHSMSNNISYFSPLHVKIPSPNGPLPGTPGFTEKPNQLHLTTPPNEAVKKVLEIVGATVTKQQQEGQNTDISKIKKTVNPTQEHIEIISPKMSSLEKVKLPEITKDRGVVTAKMVKAPLSTIPSQEDNYSIVDYTLKKVYEAKAVASCLETHRKKNTGSLEKAFCKFCGKFFENPIELHQHERYICTLNEEVQVAARSIDTPLLKGSAKEYCRLCGESFDSPIEKHQHERYLCDMNADVCRQKLRANLNELSSLSQVSPDSAGKDSEDDTDDKIKDDSVLNNEEQAALSDDQTIELESNKAEENSESEKDDTEEEGEEQDQQLQREVEEKLVEQIISDAQEQALRAFYAMQAQPSEEGMIKISQALNLDVSIISNWFQKTRQQEEDGSDPTLKGLGYAKKVELNGPISNHQDQENTSRPIPNSSPVTVRESKASETPNWRELTPEPPRKEKEVDLNKMQPAPLNLLTTSPNSCPKTSPSSRHLLLRPATSDAPLDLSVPKKVAPIPEFHLDRNSLMFGYKYPSIFSPAMNMYPGLHPPSHPPASIYFENTIKAHTSSSPMNRNLVLKRGYPEAPYLAYIPMHNAYPQVPKRPRINIPPMEYPHLPLPEIVTTETGLGKTGTIELSHSPTYTVQSPKGYSEDTHDVSSSRLDYMYDESCSEDSPGKQRRRDRVIRSVIGGLYACSQCPKTFQKHSSLLRHVYEHSGKRPHMCKECGKAFKHKHHLMEHSRLHSGEKPYQCDKCLKKFSHSGSYSQHMNHRYSYCKREDNLSTGFGRKKGATIKQIMSKEDYVQGLTAEIKCTTDTDMET